MAKRSICLYCNARKAKRVCPALDGLICSRCCGQHRIVEIDCPECTYLSNEEYQVDKRRNQELAEAIHTVDPDVVGTEVFAKSETTARFANALEQTFGLNYLEGGLKDRDVREALKAAYYQIYRKENYSPLSIFSLDIIEYLKTKLMPEFKDSLSLELQEQIILRLMLSIKKMSGGTMGDCGYLNYVKNNILSTPPDGQTVVETVTGRNLYLSNDD